MLGRYADHLLSRGRDWLAGRNPRLAFAAAHRLLKSGRPARAVRLFALAADKGHAAAAHETGLRYLAGEGVVQSPLEAARWFLRAAGQGFVPSQCALARLHLLGLPASAIEPGIGLFPQEALGGADYEAGLLWAGKAAALGSAEAQALLGFALSTGPAHLRDETAGAVWTAKAAQAGAPLGRLGYGLLLMRKADGPQAAMAAVGEINAAAAAGLASAHYYLGLAYESALGVQGDPARAAEHFEIAAKAGIGEAQTRLGLMLCEGRGRNVDPVNGETWLRRAALAGDPQAAALLCDLYLRDGALPPNYAEAEIWLKRAAETGHGGAARVLGMLYTTGAGPGLARNPDEAAVWLTRAAEAGDGIAQGEMAKLLFSGALRHAAVAPPVYEWFETAAADGDPVAAYNCAVCLAQGLGVPKDEARAMSWFRRAAESVPAAQYWYGRMLLAGGGDEQLASARSWLGRAADAGVTDAQVALGEMLVNGRGGPRDHQMARMLFETAAAKLHIGAMYALGELHGDSYDVSPDPSIAMSWFRTAAARGHPVAAQMLEQCAVSPIATSL